MCSWIMVGDNMNVYHIGLNQADVITDRITACIGYFDGLHLGHQKLIECVLQRAQATNTKPSLITFEPDPWAVIKDIDHIPHITPMKKRMEIGAQLGIEHWIILDFTKEMAALRVEEFHTHVLNKLHLDTLVCGYDFHYARKGRGSVETLKQQDHFKLQVVEEVDNDHEKISSTRIEKLILEGRMEKAAQIMGRAYEINGHVKEGRHIGRTVGFPTANLLMDDLYLIPRQGVYVGEVGVKGTWYPAFMNVGHNPSFNYQEDTSMEAHIFDFHEMIYQEPVVFRFLSFIREECTFSGKDAFITQLNKDMETAKQYFRKREEQISCV